MSNISKKERAVKALKVGAGVVVGLIFVYMFFALVNLKSTITSSLESYEMSKLGGAANYELYKKLISSKGFEIAMKGNIEGQLQQVQAIGSQTQTDLTANATSLEASKIQEIISSSVINGSKDAKRLLLEFSDFECPFCKKFHESNVVAELAKQYGADFAYGFKNFPLSFHKLAEPAAKAAVCVSKLVAVDAYYSFVSQLFATEPNMENVNKLALAAGVSNSTLSDCMAKAETAAQVSSEMKMGSELFGVQGTPGNVLINTQNGKYKVLAGAYPLAKFQEAMSELSK